jgi:spoIIIJ-associated protein
MSEFNTFTGNTLDDAIEAACRFFSTQRDKLEVEIISGGSTGIFGLVGKKKAEVRARRRQDPTRVMAEAEAEAENQPDAEESRPVQEPVVGKPKPAKEPQGKAPAAKPKPQEKPKREPAKPQRPKPAPAQEKPVQEKPAQPKPQVSQAKEQPQAEIPDEELPPNDDQTPASQELLDLTNGIMKRLLLPILEQEPSLEIEGTAGRVNVLIREEEHSGLLIGREGQTLAALQYLANRILSRQWPSPVRVQVNTGEYRERQDDSLRKLAYYLADKAKNLGKPQSTKPLSSYHRRVIHLALQTDEDIQTRSKGEGPLKRVIILPKRPKGAAQAQ